MGGTGLVPGHRDLGPGLGAARACAQQGGPASVLVDSVLWLQRPHPAFMELTVQFKRMNKKDPKVTKIFVM